MSLKIRLSRGGAKKTPYYRVVIADARSPRDGRYIERVGSYNPMVAKDHAERLTLNEERIKYWLGVGAQPTDRVARFLATAGLREKPAIHEQTKKHLPRAKTLERMKEAEEAAKAAKEAPATEEEAPAAKEEAPATEEEAPAAKEEAPPAAKEEAPPAAKEEAPPATEEEAPPAAEEAPAAEEEKKDD